MSPDVSEGIQRAREQQVREGLAAIRQRFLWDGPLVNSWRSTCAGCGLRLDSKPSA